MGVAVAAVRLHPVGGAVALLTVAAGYLRVSVEVVRADIATLT